MKIKFALAGIIGSTILSCSPKIAVKPSEPITGSTPKVAESSPVIGPEMPVSSEEIAHGKELYENNCGKCHQLFTPATYTVTDWAPILVRMQKKARLEDTSMASIRNYIHSETK